MQAKLISLALSGALLAGAAAPAAAVAAAAKPSPANNLAGKKLNVVYFLCDDLGYGDLSCTGQKKFTTPNIDRMRAEGMLFTQHYSGCPVSAPSRCALMTGLHTGHTYIRGNQTVDNPENEGQIPIPADTYNIAKLFKSAGYTTGAFGKWGLGYPGSEGDPVKQGFDRFYGYNCQGLAHRYYPDHLWSDLNKVVLEGNANGGKQQYAPDIIMAEALKFLDNNKNKPFFLFVPITLPHAELIAPEDSLLWRFRGKFPEVPFKGQDYGPDMAAVGYTSQPEPFATFAAMVTREDIFLGQIMARLKALGLDKNTMVFFSSDNGPHREGGANPDFFDSYGPFRGIKRDMWEGGIRLPLIVWAPGIVAANSTCDHVCAMWDMMPTFAELTGAALPKEAATDGISILPSITGKGNQGQHDYLYWEFHELGGRVAVRQGNWKLVMLDMDNPAKTEYYLFDLSKDMHEDTNIAAQHPDVLRRMVDIAHNARTRSKIWNFDSPMGNIGD